MMLTVDQFRRAVTTAIESRAHADALREELERTPLVDADHLRQRALTAWRAAQADERIVRQAPLDLIAEAVTGTSLARPYDPPMTPHMSVEEMCIVVQRLDAGDTVADAGRAVGRNRATVRQALPGWQAGTSRITKRAKEVGLWPSGRKSA